MKWKNLHKWNPRWYMFYSILQQSLQDGAHTIYKWSFFVPFLNGLQKSRVCLGNPYKVDSCHPTWTRLGDRFDGGTNGDGGELVGRPQRTELNFWGRSGIQKVREKKTKSSRGKMMKVPGIYVLQILQFVFIFRYLRFYVLKGEGLR